MATLNQDFTKFLEDTFVLQFNITDSSTTLSNYSAFWSCQKINGRNELAKLAIVKTTSGDFANSGSIGYQDFNIFNVYISSSDFLRKGGGGGGTANINADLVTGSYYHELTVEPPTGTDSVVIARGTMTLVDALFPDDYR
jgi:hypothetical protein